MQIILAGLYFVISWFSLFVINGILTFMLTPGEWDLATNASVFDGFFNPGYFPSLVIRTVVMFLIAGLGGLLIATRIREDDSFKERIVVFSCKWALPAALLAPPMFYWYFTTLPGTASTLLVGGAVGVGGGRMEVMNTFAVTTVVSGFVLVAGTLVYLLRPRAVNMTGALALFLVAQIGIIGAEFTREMARKPYVVYNTLYSNAVWKDKADHPEYRKQSFMSLAKWHPKVEPLSPEHGEWVYRLQCASCHTRRGYRQLASRTANWAPASGFGWLDTMHEQGIMPPFVGNDHDRAALTSYLLSLSGPAVAADRILELYRAAHPVEVAK